MIDGLLQTKLFIPAAHDALISRPHLIQKMNNGQQGKCILISAPAGYGKTSLVTSWLEQLGGETAVFWLSLDEDDSDARQFFSYLAAALQPIIGTNGTIFQLLQAPQPTSEKNLVKALINDLTAVSTPYCLILDDYHTIESLAIDKAVAFLLDNMPATMTLILTSRTDPGFPLSRLRVRRDLTEIRANDLRFTHSEAVQFLQQSMQLSLTVEQVAALEARTEGWIAGLQMAALSLQGRTNPTAFIEAFTGSHHFVLDYLVEEVLQSQTAEVRQFLLHTAILERMCGALCDAVTGQKDGSLLLGQLARANMFVIPLDDARQWYRYHHLFADMLHARLLEEQPEQVPQLHQRASSWYEEQGTSPAAIRHALAANDFEQAARLLELIWREMDITFQHNLWLSWAQTLPKTFIHDRPILSVGYAWAHLNRGELEKSQPYLQAAEQWLSPEKQESDGPPIVFDENEYQRLPVSLASARAFHAQALGDWRGTIFYGKQALALLPEEDILGRAIPNSLISLAYWANGELEEAYQSLAIGMAGFAKTGNVMAAISGVFGMADIKLAQGKLDEAQRCYTQALQLAKAKGQATVRGTEVLYLGLSELHRERNELEAANDFGQKGEMLGKQSIEPVFHYRSRVTLAQIKAEQGAFDAAHALLEEAAVFWAQIYIPDFQPLPARKARVWLREGRLDEATAWADKQMLSETATLSYLQEFEQLTVARILLAQFQQKKQGTLLEETLSLLARLEEAAKAGMRQGSLLEILLLQALVFEAAGDDKPALNKLKDALQLAKPQQYVRRFVTEGAHMLALLHRAKNETDEHQSYVAKLISAFAATPSREASPAPSALLDPLSDRELEVLRLLTTELSGPAIARELLISLNTLRTHTKNIYSKLGVNSRRTAVRQAETLNLL